VYKRQRQARGRHQHFIGSWARLNCENMAVIPAWLVRSNLNDPRKIPYLLVWKDAREGEIKESVRLAHFTGSPSEPSFATDVVSAVGLCIESTYRHCAAGLRERRQRLRGIAMDVILRPIEGGYLVFEHQQFRIQFVDPTVQQPAIHCG
jgi:hypothetical protein